MVSGELPADLLDSLPKFESGTEIATRAASGKVIQALAAKLPELWGGSADLAESNNTTIEGAGSFVPAKWATKTWSPSPAGRVLHFGIREHAMGAILNGVALSGNSRVFGGTFLVFSDYMRPAVRLAALMELPVIYVWTHDSVALGEDGPTHQPIEHLASLRAIPGLSMARPADANETAVVWHEALRRKQPVGIALTRQNLPVLPRGGAFAEASQASRGAYVLVDAEAELKVIIIATGSEVQLALEAREQLEASGVGTRVVSAPCLEWFAEQGESYREQVLPSSVSARVSVEAGSSLGWRELIGDQGVAVSIDHFGASADHKTLFEKFGITTSNVVAAAQSSLQRSKNV
jgi:transketolase